MIEKKRWKTIFPKIFLKGTAFSVFPSLFYHFLKKIKKKKCRFAFHPNAAAIANYDFKNKAIFTFHQETFHQRSYPNKGI